MITTLTSLNGVKLKALKTSFFGLTNAKGCKSVHLVEDTLRIVFFLGQQIWQCFGNKVWRILGPTDASMMDLECHLPSSGFHHYQHSGLILNFVVEEARVG